MDYKKERLIDNIDGDYKNKYESKMRVVKVMQIVFTMAFAGMFVFTSDTIPDFLMKLILNVGKFGFLVGVVGTKVYMFKEQMAEIDKYIYQYRLGRNIGIVCIALGSIMISMNDVKNYIGDFGSIIFTLSVIILSRVVMKVGESNK